MKYGYTFFCGANVVLELETFPLFECAGLSFEIHESKKPIYGYSSRFFDGVAHGQVLVTGSFLVNYIHQDYVFSAIQRGIKKQGIEDYDLMNIGIKNEYNVGMQGDSNREIYVAYEDATNLANVLKEQYWSSDSTSVKLKNPHDIFGGLTMKVTFGERNQSNNFGGKTSVTLSDVYIVGRGNRIALTEDVVVEEYSFFARNMLSGD